MNRITPAALLVPIVIPTHSGEFHESDIEYVEVQRLEETAKQAMTKQPMRIAMIDGHVFAIPLDQVPLKGIYTNQALYHMGQRDMADKETFKIGCVLTRRIHKAIYYFGGMSAAQLQASQNIRAGLASKEQQLAMQRDGENRLHGLLDDGVLSAEAAKKIIDARVKANKQAAKSAADALAVPVQQVG